MSVNYRYIGKETPRIDGMDIVTGKAAFLNDLKFHNLLFGKVLRSPYPHAIIKRIETGKAEKIKGVKAIITHETVPDWKCGNPPIRLLDKKVRYVGDAVALIAAETEQIAEEAKRLIEVEYEVLSSVLHDYEAMKSDAPQLYDDLPGNILPLGTSNTDTKWATEIVMGDVGKGFAEADVIAEGSCAYDNIPNPIPMESPAVAMWERPDKVTVWVSNHKVWNNKRMLSGILGDKVHTNH